MLCGDGDGRRYSRGGSRGGGREGICRWRGLRGGERGGLSLWV